MANILIVSLFCLVGFSLSANVGPRISDEHNIDQCEESTLLHPVLQTNIYEEAAFLSVVEKTIIVPEVGELKKPITCIKIKNEDSSKHGGYPKIVSGGLGSKSVEILLKSQWAQPLNFRIDIYTN